ncbi:MAG TPA: hypothetical protein VG267_07040 [Terracidiphilus sp.]|jgi:hypothetical protein|nr:hypothetical protein [Terracidiphilus sp.]
MTDRTRIWRVIVSALLIVLVLALTAGMVCHLHDQCSAANCTLCHLAIAPPATTIGAAGLVLATVEYTVRENSFVSRCRANEKPPRAPPA